MTSCDWIRFLFQSIPYDESVYLPEEDQRKLMADGLHTLRNILKDFDDVLERDVKWKFRQLRNDVGEFSMGAKKIYWWIEPENAMVTTGNIDAVAFAAWCNKEYDRFKVVA